MATFSNFTEVGLIDTRNNPGTITLPLTTSLPLRTIRFKDIYGTLSLRNLTLNTQSPDLFEDGTSSKTFSNDFGFMQLYAGGNNRWYILNGTVITSQTISSLTVSTIQGDGSRLFNLPAISTASLQSTVIGLGNVGYVSTAYTNQLSNFTRNILQDFSTGLSTVALFTSNTSNFSRNILQDFSTGLSTVALFTSNTSNFSRNILQDFSTGLSTVALFTSNTSNFSRNILQDYSTAISTVALFTSNTSNFSRNILQDFSTQRQSTVDGLGTAGFISSTQLFSTVRGLFGSSVVPSTLSTGAISTGSILIPYSTLSLSSFALLRTTSTQMGIGALGPPAQVYIADVLGATGNLNDTSPLLLLEQLSFSGAVTLNYSFTGADQTFTVPAGVTSLNVTLNGAGGGPADFSTSGGAGGRVSGTLAVTPGETLTLVVGAAGTYAQTSINYGGGGTAGYTGGTYKCGGGGGRTAIRRAGADIVTAGAGGGGGHGNRGGNGGGLTGETGLGSPGGNGGTQTAGGAAPTVFTTSGSLAQGGNGDNQTNGFGGGGGGSGYYGGSGGGVSNGGGGGSSYVANLTGTVVNTQGGGSASGTAGSMSITYSAPVQTRQGNPFEIRNPNNTKFFVDNNLNVGINTNSIGTGLQLDVNGNARAITVSTQALNVSTINGQTIGGPIISTVIGLGTVGYISTQSLQSTIQALGQSISTSTLNAFAISTGILFASTINFINIVPSTMNLWVAGYSNTGVPANNIITSRNGFTWSNTNVTGTFTGGARDFAFNGRMWVGVGVDTTANARIKYSYDGFTWSNSVGGDTFQTTLGTPSGYGIAWNGRYWLALGDSFNSATSNNSIKYSFDGITFSNVTSGGFNTRGAKAAWNGFMWVAAGNNLGSNGALKYSYDGLNWTNAVSRFTTTNPGGRDVAWNGKMWVAVGSASLSNDCINYSFDGINWNQCFGNNLFNSGNGVAWNGKVWVAVGDHPTNTILYSYDGINWTLGSNYLFNSSGNKVAWNGEFFIAVGGDFFGANSGTKRLSFDGITWNDTGDFSSWGIFMIGVGYSSNSPPSYRQRGFEILSQNIPYSYFSVNQLLVQNSSLTFNNTLVIDRTGVVGINCNIPQYSLDVNGSFNASNINVQGTPLQNIFGSTVNGLGTAGYTSNTQLFSTVTGLGTSGYISSTQLFSTVTGLGAGGGGGSTSNVAAFTVSTGTLFASTMSFVNINTSTLALLVATGGGVTASNIKYSLDGSNWSNGTGGFAGGGTAVAWNGRMWVAVGSGGTVTTSNIKYSFNGISWSNSASGGFSNQGNDVAWNGRMWVAVGDGGISAAHIQYSFDGSNWLNSASGSFSGLSSSANGIAWNGRFWVAVGYGPAITTTDSIKYSFDGSNWTNSVSGGFQWTGVAVGWNGRMWVAGGTAGGSSSNLQYSYDGSNWINSPDPGSIVQRVAWNGRMWLALTNFGGSPSEIIKYSYNGINWSNTSASAFAYEGFSAVWTGSLWVAVGYGNTSNESIKYSRDGINWSNSVLNGFTGTNRGRGIAFSSNVIPAYAQSNLSILPQNIPSFLTSTNTIFNQPSSMIINDTLVIDGQWDRVGINCNIPQFSLDVDGSVNVSSFSIQSTPFQNFFTSTVVGLGRTGYISSSQLFSTVTGLGAGGGGGGSTSNVAALTISTGTLFASSMSFVNINTSSMEMWVAVGQDITQNNRIKYSLNGINWSNSAGSAFSDTGFSAAWNGRIWVAVGTDATPNNTIKYSIDGINWSNSSGSGFTTGGYGIAWNGRIWVAVGQDSTQNNTIKYSTDGISWLNSSGTGFTVWGYAVAWNGTMWVATGADDTNNIKYSFNGVNWSNSLTGSFDSPVTNYAGRSIAWNGRIWVIVGGSSSSSGTIKYSSDGISWINSAGPGFGSSGSGVAWNGRMFVAVGSDFTSLNARIKYSYDGINWFNSSSSGATFAVQGQSVAWNGRLWVAGGFDNTANNTLKYSSDGITWSNSSGTGFSSNYCSGVAFSSNTTPAYAQSNFSILPQNIPVFLTSTNTILAQPSSLVINDSLIIDRQWDRVGINCNFPQYSLDINGTVNMSTVNNLLIQPVSQNIWVAVGSNLTATGRIKYSTDSITWLDSASGNNFSGNPLGVAWNGMMFVAVGTDSTANIKYSFNGINWSNSSNGFSVNGFGVAWNGRMWVAIGDDSTNNNKIKYSFNGINWSNSAGTGFTSTGVSIAWNGTMWVASGSDTTATIKYSFNGINWSNANGGFTSFGYAFAWNGRLWVGVGSDSTPNNTIKYSSDGINWSNISANGFTTYGRGIAWNGMMFVAVGSDSTRNNSIKYSFDGITWSNSSGLGFSGGLGGTGIVWNGRIWTAVGQDGSENLKYSFNGINWINVFSNHFTSWAFAVAFSSNTTFTYSQSNLNILPQNIPITLTSTNRFFATPSSLIINDTLIIDGQWDRVGINCNIPQYSLDVNGSVNVSTFSIQSTPFQNLIGSTVIGLGNIYLSTGGGGGGGITQANITSTIDGLGTYTYISTLSLQSTFQGLGNVYLSTALAQTDLTSTTRGLGNIYISTAGGGLVQADLTSTTRGLGNIYVSTAGGGIVQSDLTSTTRGLGNIYISTAGGGLVQSDLTSTTRGLGNIYLSSGVVTVTSLTANQTVSTQALFVSSFFTATRQMTPMFITF